MNSRLNSQMKQLGMYVHHRDDFRQKPKYFADIEQTLVEALMVYSNDGRIISLILSWIRVHGKYVIIEKLMKLRTDQNTHLISLMAAYACEIGVHKWKTLLKKSKKVKFLYPETITKSAVKLKSTIPWLEKINFMVPKGSLRIRESNIVAPKDLLKTHRQYKNRYLYGACWRADIITAIEERGCRTPTEIVRLIGCSYEPAHRIFKEYRMVVGY
jgi:hypothetical protein